MSVRGKVIVILLFVLLVGCGNKVPDMAVTPSPVSASDQPTNTSKSIPSVEPANSIASTEVPKPSEKPLAPEKSPLGDISDTQVFIKYSSAKGGYSLEVPEGWGRKEQEASVAFIDKLDGVGVTVTDAAQTPTVDSIKSNQAVELVKMGRAVQIANIKEVVVAKQKIVMISYSSNSNPDAVTGKQVRLENECYYFYKNNKLAALTMWAPLGADNADQWKRMTESFRWDN